MKAKTEKERKKMNTKEMQIQERKKKPRPAPFVQVSNLISDEWLTSPSVISFHPFRFKIMKPTA
jgi:hypothetical protein